MLFRRHPLRLAGLLAGMLAGCSISSAEQTMTAGNWALHVGDDEQSGALVASLRQDSATTIKDEYATKDVTPTLSFQCSPGDPALVARIDWGRFISSFNTEIGFKVDDGPRNWTKWGVDRTEKVTTSPTPDDTQLILDALVSGTRLDVEISPYSEGPVNAIYSLNGLSVALDKLRASCE